MFRKFGLIIEKEFLLDQSELHFREMFDSNIGQPTIGTYLTGPKFAFDGDLTNQTFNISQPFWLGKGGIVAGKGIISQHDGKTLIKLSAFIPFPIFIGYLVTIPTIGGIGIYQAITSDIPNSWIFLILPLVSLLFSIYFLLSSRSEVKKFARDVEREFVSWSSKSLSNSG